MSLPKTSAGESAARSRVLAPLIATLILFALGLALPVSASALRASGGSGWHAENASAAGSDASLNSVFFADAAHGWAVGHSADGVVILATTDGGATWVAQSAPVGIGSLNAVTFVNVSDGWAVGVDDAILATTDGGATWTAQDAGDAGGNAFLQSVSFVDPMHGWAVGWDASGGGVILATTDGGSTWTARDVSRTGGSVWLDSVTFVDDKHGWAVGGTNAAVVVIFNTSDGGVTWSVKDVDADSHGLASLNSVCFVDAQHGWAVGGEGGDGESCLPIMLATSDGGATWSTEKAPRVDSGAYLLSVAFVNAEHGWAVGDNNQGAAVILATSDGGATWKAQDAGIPGRLTGSHRSAALTSVAFVDATHGWAVGDSIYVPTGSSVPVILDTSTGGAPPWPGLASTVTLKLSGLKHGDLKRGQRLVAKGTVTPASLAGSKVSLTVQLKKGTKWVKAKAFSAPITSTGAYSWKYKAAKKGAYRMRATIAKTAAQTAATTKWLAFKVK